MVWNVLGTFVMIYQVLFILHWYHLVDVLLDLESCYTTLALDKQWILEEIWGSIQFYVLFCTWNLLFSVCPLFLSLSSNFPCQCTGNKKNETNMWGLGLKEVLLVIILKHSGESAIVSSKIRLRVFIHLGLKFPSDRETLLVKMVILLSLVLSSHTEEEKKC